MFTPSTCREIQRHAESEKIFGVHNLIKQNKFKTNPFWPRRLNPLTESTRHPIVRIRFYLAARRVSADALDKPLKVVLKDRPDGTTGIQLVKTWPE